MGRRLSPLKPTRPNNVSREESLFMTLALICGFTASESSYCASSTAEQTRPERGAEEAVRVSAGKVSTKRLFCSCGPIPGPCQGTLAAWCFPGAEHRSLPSLALPQQLPALGLTHTHSVEAPVLSPHTFSL
ncbi:unnamed protein product [Leuciscus chuanchicus]